MLSSFPLAAQMSGHPDSTPLPGAWIEESIKIIPSPLFILFAVAGTRFN